MIVYTEVLLLRFAIPGKNFTLTRRELQFENVRHTFALFFVIGSVLLIASLEIPFPNELENHDVTIMNDTVLVH